MKAKKVLSVFLALFVFLGAWGNFAPVTVLATNSGDTEWQANAALAGAGPDVLSRLLNEYHYDDINTREYGLGGSNTHMQGAAVDKEMKYAFFSYTTVLAVVEIATGELVASVKGFGNAHLGSIDYFDGYIYASLEYKDPGKKFYLAIFDVERLLKAGVDASVTEQDANAPIFTTVLLAEPTRDFRAPIDTTLFTGQDQYGQATNTDNNGHWFACSGIDGVTMGKWPGGKDDEIYMIVAYGVTSFEETTRNDNTYQILQYYKLSDIWNENGTPTTKNVVFDDDAATSTNWAADEQIWQTSAKTLYAYTGNTGFGVQNLEFDWDSGDIILATYDNTDMGDATAATAGGYMQLRNYYVVDGSVEPTLKTLYLGQHSTDEWAQKVAKAYANYPGAQLDENGYMKGYVGTLKCICGHNDVHSQDVTWPTGVKYSEAMICSVRWGGDFVGRPDWGLIWIGSDPNNANIDYFYGTTSGKTTMDLYKCDYSSNRYNPTPRANFDLVAWEHIADTEHGKVTGTTAPLVRKADATLTVTPDPYYCLKSLTVTDRTGNVQEVTKVNDTTYTYYVASYPTTRRVTAEFERIAEIAGYDPDAKSATVTFKEAGEYWVVFADYGENKKLENIDLVKHTFTVGENTVPQDQTDFALSTGDKVMLWGNMTGAVPVCAPYTIE